MFIDLDTSVKVKNSVFLLTIALLCCLEASADVYAWLRWKFALDTPVVERPANKFDELLYSSSDSTAIITGSSLFLYPAFLCDLERSREPNDMNKSSVLASIVSYSKADCLEKALGDKVNKRVTVANLATGGALMSDQYLVLKNWLLRGKRPKYAICDLSPREFQDNFQHQIDRTAACMALPQGFTLGETFQANLAADDLLATFKFESALVRDKAIYKAALLKHIPVLADRPIYLYESAARKQAALVSDDSDLSTSKALPRAACSLGAKGQRDSLVAYYKKAYEPLDVTMYKKEMHFLTAYTELARAYGIKVLLVMMPLPKENIDMLPLSFIEQFEKDVVRIARQSGASLVWPANHDIYTDSDYEDFAHLNARGGRKLFAAIANAVGDKATKDQRY